VDGLQPAASAQTIRRSISSFIFKSWQIDQFQPRNSSSPLVAYEIDVTRSSVDEIPERVDDAQVTVGDSISTWGISTKNPCKLQLNGFSFFEGWIEAENGIPSAQPSGTWTRTFSSAPAFSANDQT